MQPCRHSRTLRRLHSLAAYACLLASTALLSPLPARAGLNSCASSARHAFTDFAADHPGSDDITVGGCAHAHALATCHVHGVSGPCRDSLECSPEITTVEDTCDVADEADGCCIVLYRRACDECPPEAFACGQFCAHTPGYSTPPLRPRPPLLLPTAATETAVSPSGVLPPIAATDSAVSSSGAPESADGDGAAAGAPSLGPAGVESRSVELAQGPLSADVAEASGDGDVAERADESAAGCLCGRRGGMCRAGLAAAAAVPAAAVCLMLLP